jgi:hypothetical protein
MMLTVYDVSRYLEIHSINGNGKNIPYAVDMTHTGSNMGHNGGELFGLAVPYHRQFVISLSLHSS